MDYPITMTSDREQTFRVPCALNDSNMIYIGCMKVESALTMPLRRLRKSL